MDSPSRSNGSKTRPPGVRSEAASRLERVLASAIAGDRSMALNLTGAELLSESMPVARALERVLGGPDSGVVAHSRVHELFRQARVYDQLLDSLLDRNPLIRAASARICGAARIPEAVLWVADLIDDPSPKVREAAVRSLAQLGGQRSVDLLIGMSDRIPLHLLAIALSRAATDLDIEVQMRRPVSEHAAVATVMACGLRRDTPRIPALLGLAYDRRWPMQVRMAACKALAMIGNRAAADGLGRLKEVDPDSTMREAAKRAHKRLLMRAIQRPK